MPEGEQKDAEQVRMERAVANLQHWGTELSSVASGLLRCSEERRFKHSAVKLVECIRLANFLRGGADKLADVVMRALSLSAPGPFAQALRDYCSTRGGGILPSATRIRRYELALDIALMLLLQRRSANATAVLFAHADSSPMAGFDWFWSQHVEVPAAQVVPTFLALVKLQNAITDFVAKHSRSGGDSEEDEEEPVQEAAREIWKFQKPLPEWLPWLDTMRKNMFEVINPPSALGSGHRGLIHNASHTVFAWFLQSPRSRHMGAAAREYRSHTSDIGVELGIPDCQVQDHSLLLPAWMRRGSSAPDVVDGRSEALGPRGDSDAGGAGEAEAADGASLRSTPQTPRCHGNSEADCEGVCLDSPASQCSATRTPMGASRARCWTITGGPSTCSSSCCQGGSRTTRLQA